MASFRACLSLWALFCAALCVAMLVGCAGGGASRTASTAPADAPPAAREWVESVEHWAFDDAPGRIYTTAHYRLYTTETDAMIVSRAPEFLETALDQYRSGIALLPAPPRRMDTFIMDNRPQWQRLTLQVLGRRGDRISRVGRGGFTTGGKAVLYDIGLFDTLAIAAHEGWHQYTQSTFRDRLPPWAEEGVAAFMEGHKWAGSSPLFLPWANTERFDHLRRTLGAGASLSLREVLTSTPEGLLPYVDGRVLHFYSQAWALVHFLREGEGGRYRTALQSLLLDAQAGRIRQVVGLRLRELNIRPEDAGSWGEIVFRAYFEADLDDADARYQRFLRDITSTGARDRIVAGQSPLDATP